MTGRSWLDSANVNEDAVLRRSIGLMRAPLIISAVILAGLGLDLSILPTKTDRFFSWTIHPALTAGVLGCFYLTAFILLMAGLRTGLWASIRWIVPGGVVFSMLAVVATLMHLGRFHLHDPNSLTKGIAWFWLAAYAILPPALIAAVPAQLRAKGRDPEKGTVHVAAVITLGAVGGALASVGLLLFIAPSVAADVWPWALTVLTGRVLGAWCIGLGLVFGYAALERDRASARSALVGVIIFDLLNLLSLMRFSADVAWGSGAAWTLLAFDVLGVAAATASLLVADSVSRPIVAPS